MNPKTVSAISLLLIALLAGRFLPAEAYETYSTNKTTGNCASCHGDFRGDPYISLADGANWGGSLHNVHRGNMLNSDCTVCHFGSRFPVYLGSSIGNSNGFNIGCNGCHGRAETADGGTITGAGLRQHQWTSGVAQCINCQSDSNPAIFATVGEDTDTGCQSISSNDPDEATVQLGLEDNGVVYTPSILDQLPAIINANQQSPDGPQNGYNDKQK